MPIRRSVWITKDERNAFPRVLQINYVEASWLSVRSPFGLNQLISGDLMIGNTVVRTSLAVGLLISVSPFALADIMHSDVNGASVWFTNISEGSPTGDPLPLYNQPFASGDQLVFAPTAAFSATSTSGGPANQTDGKLNVIIESKPGAFIDVLDFEEVGLTILNAPFGGDAFTSVLAFAEIKILEINDAAVVSPATTHFMSFAPDSSFLHSADATGPSFATAWTGLLSVTLPEMVTKLLVTVDNHLYAASVGVGTGALIDKKTFSISVTPDGSVDPNIPEPSTLVLLALSLVGIAGRRR
jgi:PEP-CTERM motif